LRIGRWDFGKGGLWEIGKMEYWSNGKTEKRKMRGWDFGNMRKY